MFSFGIGSSVNRFLLDKMAEAGRGEVEYVGLKDDGPRPRDGFTNGTQPATDRYRIEWKNLPVADVYPKRIPDLFSAKPIVITGIPRRLRGGLSNCEELMQGVLSLGI